jgi:hypothetical protein
MKVTIVIVFFNIAYISCLFSLLHERPWRDNVVISYQHISGRFPAKILQLLLKIDLRNPNSGSSVCGCDNFVTWQII